MSPPGVVPRKFMASTNNMGNRTKIERRGNTHKGTLHIDIEITGSNVMEKKLFPHTDSAVVKA